jgi:hypothetical protein
MTTGEGAATAGVAASRCTVMVSVIVRTLGSWRALAGEIPVPLADASGPVKPAATAIPATSNASTRPAATIIAERLFIEHLLSSVRSLRMPT